MVFGVRLDFVVLALTNSAFDVGFPNHGLSFIRFSLDIVEESISESSREEG